MSYLITFILFGLCLFGMAVGLIISKKVLKKGCNLDPDDCHCRKEGKDPAQCDYDPE